MSAAIDERLEPFGLTYMRWVALKVILDGVATAGDLAREIGLTTGATTRMIDGLENQRLVVRTRCPGDRRVVRLAVTQDGENAVGNALPHVHALWNAVVEPFGQAELQHLLDAMERFGDALDQQLSAGAKISKRFSKPFSVELAT